MPISTPPFPPHSQNPSSIYDACKVVDSSIENIRSTRENIDEMFNSWYNSEIFPLTDIIGISKRVPRKANFQQKGNNVPSDSQQGHYKMGISISKDQNYAHVLFHLEPSIVTRSTSVTECVDLCVLKSLLYWEGDLPFSIQLRKGGMISGLVCKKYKFDSSHMEIHRPDILL